MATASISLKVEPGDTSCSAARLRYALAPGIWSIAAMADCASAGLVKFDLLGLGMLEALHHMIDLVRDTAGREVNLWELDVADARVYEMLCRADAVGVFQVESRAQLSTLPRLKPRCFFDLVVEVAGADLTAARQKPKPSRKKDD